MLFLEKVSNLVGLAPHKENETWNTGPTQITLAFVIAIDYPFLMDQRDPRLCRSINAFRREEALTVLLTGRKTE